MNIKKYTKNEIGTTITDPNGILNILINIVSSVSIIDEETIGIVLDKNIITQNDGHMVTINKGLNVRVAHQIHENPNIDIERVINKPSILPDLVEKANIEAHEKYIRLLKSQGITINEDGTFNLDNSGYNSCQH